MSGDGSGGEAVRNLWLAAALFAVTGCTAWVGPLPAAEAPLPAAAPVVVAPAPTTAPVTTVAYPVGVPDIMSLLLPAIPLPPGRLTLSNYSFRLADVEAIVTPYPDCALHPGLVPMDFKLPLNGTWVIAAPPGMDVCWRRSLPPGDTSGSQGWTDWNRDYTGMGRSIDATL
jgi:hypothetical protein